MTPYPRRLLTVALLLAGMPLSAASLDAALDESQRLAEEAKASQSRIENLDDASRQMLNEYRSALQQAEALEDYNAQLRELTAAQRKELAGYQQLDGIEREARRAAAQWRFAPRTENGLAVDREAVKTLYFKLERGH